MWPALTGPGWAWHARSTPGGGRHDWATGKQPRATVMPLIRYEDGTITWAPADRPRLAHPQQHTSRLDPAMG